MKDEISQVVLALRAKYPYQFHKPQFGVHITAGWLPRFVQVCDEVDQALGDDKRGFHWSGCDEKFGVARLGYSFHARGKASIAARARLRPIVDKAVSELKNRCVMCGQTGQVDATNSHLLTLCATHRKNRATADFWVIADMGSVYEGCNAWYEQRQNKESRHDGQR